jgi:microcystin-dependent protein
LATFSYPTPTANYNGGKPAIGRNVRDDLDEIRTFVVGKNLEGSNIQDDTVDLANLTAAVIEFLVPTGTILPFAGTVAPDGFLFCDHAEYDRSTYAALNALLAVNSYPYGNGNNIDTFNTPDMRGRLPIGANNANLPNGVDGARTVRDLGDEEGSETKTLSIANLPSHVHGIGNHTHPISDPGHDHSVGSSTNEDDPRIAPELGEPTGGTLFVSTEPTGITVLASGGDTDPTGSGTATDVMNPVITTNYIIKT